MALSRSHILLLCAVAVGISGYLILGDRGADGPTAVSSEAAPTPPPPPAEGSEIMRVSDIDFASYSRDLAAFIDLEVAEPLDSAVAKIERYFTPGNTADSAYQEGGAGTETSFASFDGMGGKVMVVERSNMRDDSVKAQQFYAVFKKTDTVEVLVDYGMKIKCSRGINTTKWQTELCP